LAALTFAPAMIAGRSQAAGDKEAESEAGYET
jgi:hypothetical protein